MLHKIQFCKKIKRKAFDNYEFSYNKSYPAQLPPPKNNICLVNPSREEEATSAHPEDPDTTSWKERVYYHFLQSEPFVLSNIESKVNSADVTLSSQKESKPKLAKQKKIKIECKKC